MKTTSMFLLTIMALVNGKEEDWLPKSAKEKNKIFDAIGPPPQPMPVFLGPYVFDGLTDPATGLKTPVDFLELFMTHPRTEEEKRHILKTRPLTDIQFIEHPTVAPLFYNPRDKLFAEMQNRTKNKEEPLWIDFAKLQSANLDTRSKPRKGISRYLQDRIQKLPKENYNTNYFEPNSFGLEHGEYRNMNWTTCEEFKKKSVFHPKDVIDADWLPFYTWSTVLDYSAVVHKFSYPTIKTVRRYRQEYGPYIGVKVDWNQPKLLLEEADQLLLIAADQRGLFHAIKDQKVSDYLKRHPEVKYPVITLRMKIVDPYLALMYCDDYYATIMAIKNEQPKTNEEKIAESKELNFTGIGYPVSLDVEEEIQRTQYRKVLKEREEQAKYVQLRDEDYVVPKDRYMERYF